MGHKSVSRTNEEVFAEYMAGRYRLGYGYLAQYLACSLFEKIISSKVEPQFVTYNGRMMHIDRTPLEFKINSLSTQVLRQDSLFHRRDVFKDYIFKIKETGKLERRDFSDVDDQRLGEIKFRLHNFRYLRNTIIHGNVEEQPDEKPNNRDEFIYYVWSELAPNSFERALKYWRKFPEKTIKETLWEISADYMTRAVDETMVNDQEKEFNTLVSDDFENLYTLRHKLAALKNKVEGWLGTAKPPRLMTDILTTIDTTSAYIWMPLVPISYRQRHTRDGIFNCCVSILATPLDIRIYMDFGGYAQEQRFKFYQFLKSAEYENVRLRLEGQGIMVFDIDWFSAFHNAIPIESWSQHKSSRIQHAKEKLLHTRRPVTWNRMLHGFVIPAHRLSRENGLDFEMIKQYLKTMITFYDVFEAFEPKEKFSDYKKLHGKEDDDD